MGEIESLELRGYLCFTLAEPLVFQAAESSGGEGAKDSAISGKSKVKPIDLKD